VRPSGWFPAVSLKGNDRTNGCRVELGSSDCTKEHRFFIDDEMDRKDYRQRVDAHADTTDRSTPQQFEALSTCDRFPKFIARAHITTLHRPTASD